MEFVLQYNSIVLKNKNFFYINNYCTDVKEFSEWLQYHSLTINEYEELSNEEFKNFYLEQKKQQILNNISKIQAIMRASLASANNSIEDNIVNIINVLCIYNENKYYIDVLQSKDKRVKRIRDYIERNKSVMYQLIEEYENL